MILFEKKKKIGRKKFELGLNPGKQILGSIGRPAC